MPTRLRSEVYHAAEDLYPQRDLRCYMLLLGLGISCDSPAQTSRRRRPSCSGYEAISLSASHRLRSPFHGADEVLRNANKRFAVNSLAPQLPRVCDLIRKGRRVMAIGLPNALVSTTTKL